MFPGGIVTGIFICKILRGIIFASNIFFLNAVTVLNFLRKKKVYWRWGGEPLAAKDAAARIFVFFF